MGLAFGIVLCSMSELTYIPLGVGDAFSANYYSSSVAIGCRGKWLLIDCPHPIRKMLKEASQSSGVAIDVGSMSAIALTHLHADHASGLEGFFYFSRFVLKRHPRLLAHPEVLARVWPDHLAAGMDCLMAGDHVVQPMEASQYYSGEALSEDSTFEIDGFSIECRKTIHHIPTTAFLIRSEGRCIGYSADTAFDLELINWLSQADVIIHETNYGIHTPYEKLLSLPASLRSKMRLIHYPDDFDVEGSKIEALRQGKLYTV